LLLDKEADDTVDANRRQQHAYAGKERYKAALNRGRCASLPIRMVMASIVTGTVGSMAAISERTHFEA
jgi:hypothetical protein